MRSFIKKIVALTFGYRRFLILAIQLKYLFRNNDAINKTESIYNSLDVFLLKNGMQKYSCIEISEDNLFTSMSSNLVSSWQSLRAEKELSLRRVVIKDAELFVNNSVLSYLFQSRILSICDSYFDFDYSLVTLQVWWGRPNYDGSGYKQYHLDRNHRKCLHFDINLIDMAPQCGAVSVVSKNHSRIISRKMGLWGSEFLPTDFQPQQVVNDALIVEGDGQAGTVMIHDAMQTLHKGGNCIDGDRLILHINLEESRCINPEKKAIFVSRQTLYQKKHAFLKHQ